MKIQTSQKVLGLPQSFWAITNDTAPEPIQEVTAKELKEAVQDYLLSILEWSATLRHREDPMGKLEGTEEFSTEVVKQVNRIKKLFGY